MCVDPKSAVNRKPVTEKKVKEIDTILGDFDPSKLKNIDQLYANSQITLTVDESGS